MKTSSATRARIRAGISLDELARRARLHPRYLREIELHGCASYDRALKLSRLVGCAPDVFRRRRDGDFQGLLPNPPTATGADTSSTRSALCAGRGSVQQSQRYRPRKSREAHLYLVTGENDG